MWVVREREIICWSKSLCQIVTIPIFLSGGCFLSAISSTCKCVSLWQTIYSLCGSLNLLPLVNIHVMFITEAHSRWPLLPFWHTETPPVTLLSSSRGTLVQEISFNHWSPLKCQATNCSEFISRLTRTGKPIGRGCYYPLPSSSYILNRHSVSLSLSKSCTSSSSADAMKGLQLLVAILFALHCTNGALQELFRWKQIGYRDLPASKLCN